MVADESTARVHTQPNPTQPNHARVAASCAPRHYKWQGSLLTTIATFRVAHPAQVQSQPAVLFTAPTAVSVRAVQLRLSRFDSAAAVKTEMARYRRTSPAPLAAVALLLFLIGAFRCAAAARTLPAVPRGNLLVVAAYLG